MSRTPRVLAVLVLATALATPAGAQPASSGVKADWRGTGVVLAILRPPSDLHATRPVIVTATSRFPV